jgi:hypothetical protein
MTNALEYTYQQNQEVLNKADILYDKSLSFDNQLTLTQVEQKQQYIDDNSLFNSPFYINISPNQYQYYLQHDGEKYSIVFQNKLTVIPNLQDKYNFDKHNLVLYRFNLTRQTSVNGEWIVNDCMTLTHDDVEWGLSEQWREFEPTNFNVYREIQ